MAAVMVAAKDAPARVVRTDEIAAGVYATRLHAPVVAASAVPGQFVQLRAGCGVAPLLRLPLSIAGADPGAGTADVIYERVGPKTAALAAVPAGGPVACLGPLGRGFRPTPGHSAILVGGGIGTPPLLFLGSRLQADGVHVELLAGARTAAKLLPATMLAAAAQRFSCSTDDGTSGCHGPVTDLLIPALARAPRATVYSCGPPGMLRAVASLCAQHGVECQVSLEEYMACGFGICMGCAVPVVAAAAGTAGAAYERYQRVCVHGPVFDATAVDWGDHG